MKATGILTALGFLGLTVMLRPVAWSKQPMSERIGWATKNSLTQGTPPAQQPDAGGKPDSPGTGSFALYLPASIHALVRDPLGRRVGSDGKQVFREIVGSSYVEEQVTDRPKDRVQASDATRVLFIPNPAEGVYQLEFYGVTGRLAEAHLYRYTNDGRPQVAETFALDLSPGATATRTATYSTKSGDLNGDGLVDNSDLNIIRAAYGRKRKQPGFDSVADTNRDGVVDDLDLSYVVRNFKR